MSTLPRGPDPTLWPRFAEPLLGIARRAVRPGDSADLAFRKTVFCAGMLLVVPSQLLVAVALLVMGAWANAALVVALSAGVVATVAMLIRQPSLFTPFVGMFIVVNQVASLAIGASNGGMVGGGFNVFWTMLGPVATVMLLGPEAAALAFCSFVAILSTLVFMEPPETLARIAFGPWTAILNVSMAVAALLVILAYFDQHRRRTYAELDRERARADDLLAGVLPEAIIERLKQGEDRISDHVADASILFADLVGFTRLSESLPPAELVALLEDLFGAADVLVTRHHLEKIKTIGDCYMVAGGVPEPREGHAEDLARFAVALLELVAEPRFAKHGLALRIGMHRGPVVAGVLGRQRFTYDLWGDTVNVASRMESTGVAGAVHLTEAMAEALRGRFACTPRGEVEIKGKGAMPTYFLG